MKKIVIIFLLAINSIYSQNDFQDASLKSLDDLLEYSTVNSGLNISDGDQLKQRYRKTDI
jgi:hypothetical protein